MMLVLVSGAALDVCNQNLVSTIACTYEFDTDRGVAIGGCHVIVVSFVRVSCYFCTREANRQTVVYCIALGQWCPHRRL